MIAIKEQVSGVFAAFLACVFALTGVRSRVLGLNLEIATLKIPQFYRFRLGFRLARILLTLVWPGRLPEPRLHPRSRAGLEALRGGPSLLLTAHFENWEAQAAAWGRLGVRLLGAARPLKGRAANLLLSRVRARHGIRVVSTAVPRAALRHITPTPAFPGGCFGLLWDQHAPDSTRPGTFFGEPVSLNPLPFFLLAHRPCPVFFGVLLPGGTLRLVPLLRRFDPGWEDRLARRYHRVLETLIRRHPTHWFGALHARFKMTRVYEGHRRGT